MKSWLTLVGVLLSASVVLATDIRLNSGQTYNGVSILSRTPAALEVRVSHGVITIPIDEIENIDGVRVRPVTLPEPGPDRPPPAPAANQVSVAPYVHNWRMEIFLGLLAAGIGLWLAMVLWVQHDVQGTTAEIKRANADVLLLPGLGLVLYFIARSKRRKRRPELRTLDSRVSGLRPDETPKKRGLFGGRTRHAPAFHETRPGVELEFLDANRNPIQIRKDMPEMSGIEAAREVLEGAIADRASDVHLEPHEGGCRVRFRVDGVLQERMTFERADGIRVASALKSLAQIDVAEKRRAQDGRFRVRTSAGEVDFRVATASSIHGEKVVLRILDRKHGRLGLTDLGMPKEMMAQFDRIIRSRNGIILATGPTGSGKTSTLYAALSRLDAKSLNIMTIEDPVEYELDGATQMPVNAKAGITYEAGLRSILRQDPDVIFVGEMRDQEAATIAVRAALTGHLVFTSLHTQDAPGSVVRLTEMGVERYQIASALLLVLTQRLVRVLCEDCGEPHATTGDELNDIGLKLPAGKQIYRATGCASCDHTGYQGRTGIFEMLVMDEVMRKAVTDGAGQQELATLAARAGYRPYREDGVTKILGGITTVEEVLQAS